MTEQLSQTSSRIVSVVAEIHGMAAAQVAKKLKDKRQKRTIEGIFRKVGRVFRIVVKYKCMCPSRCSVLNMKLGKFSYQHFFMTPISAVFPGNMQIL